MHAQPHPDPHVGEYDPKLGRVRTHSDDFYDHRMMILEGVRAALQAGKERRR